MNAKWRWLLLVIIALLTLLVSVAQEAAAQQLLGHQIFVSSSGSGVIDGIAYNDEDILLNLRVRGQDGWLMFFDGSAAGLPASADIDALDVAALAIFSTNLHEYFDRAYPESIEGLSTVFTNRT